MTSVLDSYVQWLRDGLSSEALEDGLTELTTPFLDRHNDHLQLYAEKRNEDAYLLTDDGYIVAELKSSGVEPRGKRRAELFSQILTPYGVRLHDRELQTDASAADLGQKVHNLVQAMLSIDDMFVLAQPTVETIFTEDVARFLDEREIRYSPGAKFAGKSGLDHLVDFVIPKSRSAPERFLQVLNSPRRNRVDSLLFTASDTRATRHHAVDFYAIINDERTETPADILGALREYDVRAVPWSSRYELVDELAA